MSTSDAYDLTILAIVIISAVHGFQKGFIHQLGALLAIMVGNIVSVQFTPALAVHLPVSDNIKSVSAFVILLIVTTLVVWGIVNLLNHIIVNLKLNSWNKQMGALLGVVYGILWAITLTFILLVYAVPVPVPESNIVVDENGNRIAQTTSDEKSFIMKSKSGPLLTTAALGIIDHLPHGGDSYQFYDYLRECLQANANEIKESNPDLPKEAFPFSTTGESSQDDEKPQLPISSPSNE